MSLHIYIDTILHNEQRYPTVGDYWESQLTAPSQSVLVVKSSLVVESSARSAETRETTTTDSSIQEGVVEVRRIKVSEMGNSDYEFLVAIHEAIEQHLCKKRGISEEAITAFDTQFEASRAAENVDEPGNDLKAPYHKEHLFSTWIERLVAKELGIDWDVYDNVVNSLSGVSR
jgi:hypothetical protein